MTIRYIIVGVVLIYVWNVMPDLLKQEKQAREQKMDRIWSDCCSVKPFFKCLEERGYQKP